MPSHARNKLSDRRVQSEKKPGIYGDGGGLYLRVHPSGRSWIFTGTLKPKGQLKIKNTGKGDRNELGLGSALGVGLAKARQRAAEIRDMLLQSYIEINGRAIICNAISNCIVIALFRGSAATCDEHPAKELEMGQTLIELGVPLEARDSLGWTALMGCDSPPLAQLLLKHGANPNARDKEGTTPLLSTEDDRVAVTLLRAGADPRAKDENDEVRAQAAKGHMPATLAWLDAQGVQ